MVTNILLTHFLLIFQIRETGTDERGVTSSLGRPFGSREEKVEVGELLWGLACASPQQQQQQQQQQQRCPPKEQCNCNEEATISMAVLLVAETLLGAILVAFPQSRACVAAALDWVRAIKILKRTPSPQLIDLAGGPPATVAPVLGNFKILSIIKL